MILYLNLNNYHQQCTVLQYNRSIITGFGDKKSRLFVHYDDDVFPNYFENGGGLDDFGEMEFDAIKFEHDFRIHQESINAVVEVGSSLQSFVPMIVYHKHVWWNYGYKLTLEQDNTFSLLLKSIGPTQNPDKEVPRGAIGNNSPSNQKAPPAFNVHVTIGVKNNGNFDKVAEGELGEALGIGYICNQLIDQSELKKLADSNEFVIIRVALLVDKSYFNIEKLTEVVTPRIIEFTNDADDKMLEKVLECKKCPDSDFVFTRGNSARNEASSYFVHQNMLKKRSSMLEIILTQKCSLPTDQMLVLDTENRIIFPHFTDGDMKFLLTYLYTGNVILPEFDGFARVGRVISLLIDREQLMSIFMHWQKLIVMNLLQAEQSNDSDRIVNESLRALISVYSAPYGAIPHAKRTAISMIADQITKSREDIMEMYDENSHYEKYPTGHFMMSALKLKRLIASVKKMPHSL